MIHQMLGLTPLNFPRELPLLRLLSVFLCFLFLAPISAEVKLKGVSVEPGSPGDWTVARVRLHNSGEDSKNLGIRWTMGSIETSVFEQKMDIFIPAESTRMVWAPVWIPKDIIKKGKSSPGQKKTRDFLNLSVQLFENGALKSRESALGTLEDAVLMRGMNLGRNRDKNHQYDPLASMKPTEGSVLPEVVGWGKNRWTYKQRADEIHGYSYLHPDLIDRKSVIWIQKNYDQTHGLWNILNWVERGGLLLIDPMDQEELGPLANIIGVNLGGVVWNSLARESLKMDGVQPLMGREVFTDQSWKPVLLDRGVKIADTRDWGLGRIVMLNYRWNALAGKDRERAKRILVLLHPKGFANEFSSNQWNEQAETSLVMRHGNQIWSRETVMMYLGSLVVFSLLLWLIPFFANRREMRWGIWTLGMLLWTGGGLAVLLNKASAGAKFSSEILSYGKAGGTVEKVQGYSAFYSESLRKFDLTFEDGVDVTRKTATKSNSMEKTNGELSFEDFGLQPMRINLLRWSQAHEGQLPKVKCIWGNALSFELPKELMGKDIAVVMGRKIWEAKAQAKLKLNLSEGRGLSEGNEVSVLEQAAIRLSKQSSDNRGSLGTNRRWLLYETKSQAPFEFPQDIERNETHVRVLEIDPIYETGSFQLSSGMAEWYFRRGKGVKTWKTNDLGFDGLDFKTESVNMSLGWRFEVPGEIKHRFKADQVSLAVNDIPESVSPNSIYAIVKGKRQRLKVSNGKINLPKEAYENGAVEIEISPPLPKMGASAMMRAPWRPWVSGLELKGNLK